MPIGQAIARMVRPPTVTQSPSESTPPISVTT